MYSANWIVSPASPEKARRVCLLSCLVLSSEVFNIVAPRMAALEAAMMVKSRPVRPRRTSLEMSVSSKSGVEHWGRALHVEGDIVYGQASEE